jgi:uncharacterized protein (TIRG00374 family)
MNRRRTLTILGGLGIGILLILLWSRFIEVEEVMERIRGIRATPVLLAGISYMLAYFVRSVRWNVLLRNQVRVSVWRSWQYSMAGNFVNYLIPIRLGEVVKAWFIRHKHDIGISRALPSIFIDKSFDTIGIFFVILMLPFISIQLSAPMLTLLGLLAAVFLLSLFLLIFAAYRKHSVVKVLQALISWLPNKVRGKLDGFIKLFVQGLNVFEHHWSILLLCICLTALGVLLDGLYFWLVFRAFGDMFPFGKVLFGYTLINLSYALPQPPAQLGSNEWMMIVIFSVGFGLTANAASAIMAFAHVFTFLLMSVAGLAAIGMNGKRVLKAVFKGENIDEQ